jgi:cell division protein FtsQ
VKDKKIKISHSIFWEITAIFLLISFFVITVYISLKVMQSTFPMQHIVFVGNKHLTDDELKALAGIHGNECLLTISSRKLSQKLLQSPWIRRVSIRKEFPINLSVMIEEAVPFALLDKDGHLFLAEENGRLLEELRGDSVPFLPIIKCDPVKDAEGFSDAIQLAKIMKGRGLTSEKNHIEILASKPEDLTVIIDGTVVKVGAGRYEEKLGRLIELEDEIQRRKILVDYIDLRFENRVVVKPISEVIK